MMEIVQKSSPHLRRPNARVIRMMRDVAIALLPLVVFAIYSHGLSALWIILAAVGSMVLTEYVYYVIQDKINDGKFQLNNPSFSLYNYSVIVSGLIYGLILPDKIPIQVVIIGGVVGVLLAKLIFGGLGQNIFNIAGFARIFAALSFGAMLGYSNHVDADAGATVLGVLAQNPFSDGVLENYSLWTMFSGLGMPGSIGETSALLIIVGGLYMFLRKSFDVYVPLVVMGTVAVLSAAVMLATDGVGWWFVATQLFSGGLMFGAVYMATDPISIPVTRPGRIYFAFGVGLLTFVIRLFGTYPEGVVFAIVIMNMFVPAIDYAKWSKNKFSLKSGLIFGAVAVISVIGVVVGASYVG